MRTPAGYTRANNMRDFDRTTRGGVGAVLLGLALAAVAIGAGWAAGVATKLPAGTGALAPNGGYAYWGFHPWGFFPFFGFLWFFVILFIFFGIFRAARFGRWRHHGGFEEWHRRPGTVGAACMPPTPSPRPRNRRGGMLAAHPITEAAKS